MSKCCTTCENTATILITEKEVDRIKEIARQEFKNATYVPDNTLLILSGLEGYLKSKGILTNFTVEVRSPDDFYDNLSDD